MGVSDRGERADVVIIGGGVIGLALAYELARRGRPPLVLEREQPGREATGGAATWAAGGMLAPISEADIQNLPLIEFGLDSLRRYPAFVLALEDLTGIPCGYRTDGALWVALNRDQAEELEHLAATMKMKSLRARSLSSEDVLEREPHLSGRVVGGLLVEEDHQVDPRALCRCLRRAVERLGGRVKAGAAVTAVEPRAGGGFLVRCRNGLDSELVACTSVVAAAGSWTGEAIRLPLESLGVRPIKGQLVRLRGGKLLRHMIRNPECYLVPREDGELLVGATMEEQGFDIAPTAGAVLDLLRHAWQILPGLYDLNLVEVSVGLRPAVADHLPVIGPTEVEGLYLATAHFRGGILLAPATAHYLAEAIVSGAIPAELRPFTVERLRGKPVGRTAEVRDDERN